MNSSESLELDSVLSESGESPEITPKIVTVTEKGFFASWFNTVDPNAPVREDEYFWPSGLPLESDNFEDEDELDNYLSTSPKTFGIVDDLEPLALDDVMSVMSDDSAVEMLSITSDVSDWTKMPPVLPPLGDLDDVDDLIPVPIMRKVSDWSEMPPVLPPLPSEVRLEPTALKREKSDWTKMPPILPPINPLGAPPMIPQYSSDWSVMPVPLLPFDLIRDRSRPMELPTQAPQFSLVAPAPLVPAVSEPMPLIRSYPAPIMQPSASWNPTSTFVPFGSNDNAVAAMECQNMVPSLHVSSPTQQFAMPSNLPQMSWEGNQDGSIEFLEPEWGYEDSSPDQILDCDVQCDHGSLVTSQGTGPTVVNQNMDLHVANPETALVLYQPNSLAPNLQSSRKATEQFTSRVMGKYKVIISNIPCESISVPVSGTNQICHTDVFPYIAVDNLGKSHYGFHFQSYFAEPKPNCYI